MMFVYFLCLWWLFQYKRDSAVDVHTQTDPDTEAFENMALVASLTQDVNGLREEVEVLQERLSDASYLADEAKEQLAALQVSKLNVQCILVNSCLCGNMLDDYLKRV
jgi:uncharacterized protein YlxW (UPF0749 family)